MKIIEKIKKVIISALTFFITLPTKIFAIDPSELPLSNQVEYGIEPIGYREWNFTKFIIIPIALVTGLIIYYKKSESSVKNKIITSIAITIVVLFLIFVIDSRYKFFF